MMFDLKNLEIQILKKFNGLNNYFNPSYFEGDVTQIRGNIHKTLHVTKTIFRRESIFNNKILVSDIVDDQDNVLLQHYIDENFLWSYEDARFINDNEISVCCCKRDKNDLVKIINVEYKKYNLTTKELTHFKTQNAHFEKHWQFYNDKIIYHVNPYTLMDMSEDITYKKQINWDPWISKYGTPGLSTNIFEVSGKKYLLFHSYITLDHLYYKYFVGLMRLNDNIEPIGYYIEPFFEAKKEYTDASLLTSLWEWRNVECQPVVKYEVIFPMNVVIKESQLNIFSGLNDCSCVNIRISKDEFEYKIKNQAVILA
jgi:hypothetical protein